ncbi:MAG: hypothetical protein EX254_10495 [Flavobacteriaceae bacterium]|nr:MAG: hypothetical protein EX254_10495 [Flavobacteriaceae bacterium]
MKFTNASFLYAAGLLLIGFSSCTEINSQPLELPNLDRNAFNDYWYAGNAELTRYELEQSRYGELHKGHAVLIFVTEDFNTKDQVKHERGGKGPDVQSVLKLNFTKKFNTGLYPYSLMSSIFTPVNLGKTYKVTTTSQEWCGHTFSQLNLGKGKYKGQLYSYFQQEGDESFTLDDVYLEDEIWNRIRLNPTSLPTGEIRLIPGTQFLRLKHRPHKEESANAALSDFSDGDLSEKAMIKYVVEYANFKRKLNIIFEKTFPHRILAWEEYDSNGLVTKAVRTHEMKSAYWGQNSVKDAAFRNELGLE